MVSKKQKRKPRARQRAPEHARPIGERPGGAKGLAWDGFALLVTVSITAGVWYYGFLGTGFWGVLGAVGTLIPMSYAIGYLFDVVSPFPELQQRPARPAPGSQQASKFITWKQLEALGGRTAAGEILEVRVVGCSRIIRMVMDCKDRDGTVRRIAAYTDSRTIPDVKEGCILRWHNPRFHRFMDGSSGARIEEDDLTGIQISYGMYLQSKIWY